MIELYNKKGEVIPSIGLGTYPFQGNIMADVVIAAIREGYRLIDTSDDYRGESGIGLAVDELLKSGKYAREDLFLQTKISDNNAYADESQKGVYFNKNSKMMQRHSVEEIVWDKVATSLREMHTDYLDSLLIHFPFPDFYVDVWRELIKLKERGLVRYIGVSNFHEHHIDTLIRETGVTPEINEIYISPIGNKQLLVDYCISNKCLPMAYSPLKDVVSNRIQQSEIQPLMEKYKKSMSQIVLRWNVERGCVPLPKSQNPNRLRENFAVFDFSLTEEEMLLISTLNYDYQFVVESKTCPGL